MGANSVNCNFFERIDKFSQTKKKPNRQQKDQLWKKEEEVEKGILENLVGETEGPLLLFLDDF
jgi:hypothetical protein